MSKDKKGYSCTTWIKGEEKSKPIFWENITLAIVYLTDIINSMEKGKVTKVECSFGKKKTSIQRAKYDALGVMINDKK